jgi:hypothetical protein
VAQYPIPKLAYQALFLWEILWKSKHLEDCEGEDDIKMYCREISSEDED